MLIQRPQSKLHWVIKSLINRKQLCVVYVHCWFTHLLIIKIYLSQKM